MSTRGGVEDILDQALRASSATANRAAVAEDLAVRVSLPGRGAIGGHLKEANRLLSAHPVLGDWFEGLPEDILTADSDDYRRQHGLFPILECDIHPAATSSRLIGYAAVAVSAAGEACGVLLVGSSAATATIEVSPSLPPQNAWMLLVLAMWKWSHRARRFRFNRDDRMARELSVFAAINKAIKERPGATYMWGHEEIDPHRDDWRAVIGAQRSSSDSDTTKLRTTSGRLRRLQRGVPLSLPAGFRYPSIDVGEGRLATDTSAKPEPDPRQTSLLEAAFSAYAAGSTKEVIALEAARNGARDGNGALLLGKLAPLLDAHDREDAAQVLARFAASDYEREYVECRLAGAATRVERANATQAAQVFVDRVLRHRQLLRTGSYTVLHRAPMKGRTDYYGWRPTFVVDDSPDLLLDDDRVNYVLESDLPAKHPYWEANDDDRRSLREHGFWTFTLELGTGLDLPDKVWKCVEHRIHQDREDWHRARQATSDRRPLVGLRWRQQHDGEPWLMALGSSGEVELTPVLGAPVSSLGARGGMTVGERLVSFSTASLNKALGRRLLELAERIEAQPVPLLPAHPEPATDTAADKARRRLAELTEERARLTKRFVGYARDLADLERDTHEYAELVAARDEDRNRAERLDSSLIPEAEREIAASERTEPTSDAGNPQGEPVGAELTHLRAAGLALERTSTKAPPTLANVVSWLLEGGRGFSNLRTGCNPRQVLVDVTVRVLLADGTVERLDAGTLDLTDRSLTSTRRKEYLDDAARRLFWEREPLGEVAKRYEYSVRELLPALSRWLRGHGVAHRSVRSALVDAAALDGASPAAEIAYAILTDQHREDLDRRYPTWLVAAVRDSYLSPTATWSHATGYVRSPLAAWRTAMASVAQAGETTRQTLARSIPGLRNEEHVRDRLVPERTPHWLPPLRYDRGWITTYRCTQSGCPGGAATPMTAFLPVPELVISGAAVFCASCLRAADGRDVPSFYSLPWDTRGDISLKDARGLSRISEVPTAIPLAPAMLTTGELAERTHVPLSRLQRLASRGALPHNRTAGGKLRFPVSILTDPATTRILEDQKRAAASATTGPTNVQLFDRAAVVEQLGIQDRYLLRTLTSMKLLTNVGTRDTPRFQPSQVAELLSLLREELADESADFRDVLTREDAMRELRVSRATIDRLIQYDVISKVYLRDVRFIPRRSVDGLEPIVREALTEGLFLDQAAEHADVLPSAIESATSAGDLRPVVVYPRACPRYLPDDLHAWLRSPVTGCMSDTAIGSPPPARPLRRPDRLAPLEAGGALT